MALQALQDDIRGHHTPEDPLGDLPVPLTAAGELWEALLTGRLRPGFRHWLCTNLGEAVQTLTKQLAKPLRVGRMQHPSWSLWKSDLQAQAAMQALHGSPQNHCSLMYSFQAGKSSGGPGELTAQGGLKALQR